MNYISQDKYLIKNFIIYYINLRLLLSGIIHYGLTLKSYDRYTIVI